jgi:hypothetical protein
MKEFKRKAITTEVTEEHRGKFSEFLRVPPCSRWAKGLWNVALATLREIFDESAYDRFLARHNLTPSPASYADFRAEHETTKLRRPRCC